MANRLQAAIDADLQPEPQGSVPFSPSDTAVCISLR